LASFTVNTPVATDDAMRELSRSTPVLDRLKIRRDQWRSLLDVYRTELNKHNLDEYFRIRNDIWRFHKANQSIRTQIRNRDAFMIRIDGVVIFELAEAVNLLSMHTSVDELQHHVQCNYLPVLTGFDDFGHFTAGVDQRIVIRHLKYHELREYCAEYGQVIPVELRDPNIFDVPDQHNGVVRNIRRRLI
jgi:hypothetical protein